MIETLRRPSLFEEVLVDTPLRTDEFDRLVSQYHHVPDTKKGRRKKTRIINQLVELMSPVTERVMQLEIQRSSEVALDLGYETLTTDTKGRRSREYLDRTGSAFATGVAHTCVAVAVTHDDIGMGAAHRNTATEGAIKRFIERCLVNKAKIEGKNGQITPEDICSPGIIKTVVGQTINEAFNEFVELCRENGLSSPPQEGVQTCVVGVDFLDPSSVVKIEATIRKAMGKHHSFHNGSLLGRTRIIQLVSELGKSGGVIYGGPNHPKYNTPQFYKIESEE